MYLRKRLWLAGLFLTFVAATVTVSSSKTHNSENLPSIITNTLPSSFPYLRTFQIENSSSGSSPWQLFPGDNNTVWVEAIKNGYPPTSQIIKFTMLSPTQGVSQTAVNLNTTIPNDVVYDHSRRLVWIVEDYQLAYYNPSTNKTIVAENFPNGRPQFLTLDSQNHLWLTLLSTDQVVRFDPISGTTLNYSTPTSNAGLQGITVSPVDDSIWFAEAYLGKIGHLAACRTSSCPIVEYSPPQGLNLGGLIQVAVDKSGIVWFTVHNGNEFGSFNPTTGKWDLFPIGYCSNARVPDCEAGLPNAITLSSDGQVWFAEHYAGRVARYDLADRSLTEYSMPTESLVCKSKCIPLVWWMWPGQGNLVWFSAYGLGEIGYVNATVPVPYTITAPSSVTIVQGKSVRFQTTVMFEGNAPSLNMTATTLDQATDPSMFSWTLSQPVLSQAGSSESSTVIFSTAWSSITGSRYVAVSAYDQNLTVNRFVGIEVQASFSAYATIGLASGTSAFTVGIVLFNQYSEYKKRRVSRADEKSNVN